MERLRRRVNASGRGGGLMGRAAAGLLALSMTGGCTLYVSEYVGNIFESPSTRRGNQLDAEQLAQLVPGVSSRTDAQAALGSPTATATFTDDEWYYISSVTRQRPGRELAVEDQQVVVLRFNQGGVLQDVRRLGAQDARQVAMVERVTPSPGNERSFLQQLFGNIGRVGPGLGASQPTAPGGPSPSGR
jgi:outer membrane protein assembly factor BamE (lipoprotein component of BamABCDE complex)